MLDITLQTILKHLKFMIKIFNMSNNFNLITQTAIVTSPGDLD